MGSQKPLLGIGVWDRWRRKGRFLAGISKRSLILLITGLAVALMVHLPLAAIAQEASISQPPASNLPASELRGVWLTNVDSEVLFSKSNLEQGMERLKNLKFNTIYPTVWNEGYTLYPSAVAERVTGVKLDPDPRLEGRDMLKEAIELGHEKNLTVIPWFEFGLMAPAESELVRQHPNWIGKRKDGSQVYTMHSKQMVWLNPAHEEVQDFIRDMMIEVVEKYDVDGIQLDDHFGMPVELGYDDYTVELYKKEHQGKAPPANPNNKAWMRWRASKVTDLMLAIYSGIKTRKPNCIVSVSPNPRVFSYEMFLQDWASWARLGFVDEIIVQVYRNDFSRYLYELADFNRPEMISIRQRIPVSVGILTGLRVMNIDISQIQKQVQTARDRRLSGFSFFFYESLGDRDDSFQAMLVGSADRPGKVSPTRIAAPPESLPPVSRQQQDRQERIERRERLNRPSDN
jgi:uncharacterized lipoprotein YddW (UPF0748 family)